MSNREKTYSVALEFTERSEGVSLVQLLASTMRAAEKTGPAIPMTAPENSTETF
jgi:hypothetical protein